jgi:predicted RNA-binding Zn ribbon-like protein
MDFIFLDFVNSAWNMTHPPYREVLTDEKWIAEFQARWYCQTTPPVSPDQMRQLIVIRSECNEILDQLSQDKSISPEYLILFNRYLAGSPLTTQIRIDATGIRKEYKAKEGTLDYLVYKIMNDFLSILEINDPASLKRCQNPACGWVFVDESKNKSRKWCGNTCASLMKVRQFRQNKKENIR